MHDYVFVNKKAWEVFSLTSR